MKNVCIDLHIEGSEEWEGDMHFYGGEEHFTENDTQAIANVLLDVCRKNKINIRQVNVGHRYDPRSTTKKTTKKTK